ncbi:MAG: efflux RND transporter periplasmic adaptor subunit [bacterium]|nr:efflux RND transporter periplasmic adaptor subunit [bacterium]
MNCRSGWIVTLVVMGSSAAFAQMPRTKVVVERAQTRALPATMRLVATVRPVVRSVLGSEVEGLVVEMPAREGDLMERDGVVCRLNGETLAAQLASARANLGALQARLKELQTGTRAEELARLKAALEEAKARHVQWTQEVQRVEGLQSKSRSNPKEVWDTEAEYRAAEQRMLSAQAAYDEGVNGPRAEVIAQASFAVAEQAAVVERIERDLAKTVIRAPFSGHVVRREAERGQWVERGGAIVELIDLSSVLVRVDAPEQAFPYVHVGDEARLRVDALGAVFTGRIKHVIPQADEASRTFPVEVVIDNADGRLKGGMIAWATLITGPERDAVAVPKDAVDVRGGTAHVCVVMPTEQGLTAIPTAVTTGADIDDWIAVTSGNVAPGTQVVVRGNERISFPTPVEFSGEESPDTPPPASETQP